MEPRSYSYILEGTPQALTLRRSEDIVGWNNHKEYKLITDLAIEYQHGNKPLLTGPLLLEAVFYFHTPTSPKAKVRGKTGNPCFQKPSIFFLLHFLEHSAQGRIFADTGNIASIICRKVYDPVPRTVFTFTEIYESKKDNKRVQS